MLKISTLLALAALLNSFGGAAGATEIETGVSAVLQRVPSSRWAVLWV